MAALYKKQLGELIRERREELRLTQKDLANRAHIEEPQTVSRWERGLNAPTDLEAVAVALETTASELLSRLSPAAMARDANRLKGQISQLDRIEAKLDLLIAKLLEPSDADLQQAADELGLGEEFARSLERAAERELHARPAARAARRPAKPTRRAG